MVNKKIVLSILTVALMSVVAAGTWASVVSSANAPVIAATSGDIVIGVGELTWSPTAAHTDMLPGEVTSASFTVSNSGSRTGYLFMTPTITDAAGIDPTVEYSLDGSTWIPFTTATSTITGIPIDTLDSQAIQVRLTMPQPDNNANLPDGGVTVSIACALNQFNSVTNT